MSHVIANPTHAPTDKSLEEIAREAAIKLRQRLAATVGNGIVSLSSETFTEVLQDCRSHILAALCTALAKQEDDTKRLDWLEQHPFTAYQHRDIETRRIGKAVVVDEDKGETYGRTGLVRLTLREAIDAAAQEEGK